MLSINMDYILIKIPENGYTNTAFEKYDQYLFDISSGKAYQDKWHQILEDEYGCVISKDKDGHRYINMPSESYTLFLLKWS